MFKRLILATSAVLLTSLSISPDGLSSRRDNPCNYLDLKFEEPSKTLRTVQLPTLGVTVDIPSNYRMVLFQNGRIEILSPAEFKFFQCIAKHGTEGLVGGGRFSQSFRALTQSETIRLLETHRNDGSGIWQYSTSNFDGFIITSSSGYGASFVGTLPNRSRLGRMSHIEVSIYCDCPVEVSDLLDLLSRIKPMP